MARSKSVPSPRRLMLIISRFNSNTEIPVPSKVTREGSFWDLNLKKTEEDMVRESVYELIRIKINSDKLRTLDTRSDVQVVVFRSYCFALLPVLAM